MAILALCFMDGAAISGGTMLGRVTADMESPDLETAAQARLELIELAHVAPDLLAPFDCVRIAIEHANPQVADTGIGLLTIIQSRGVPTQDFSNSLAKVFSRQVSPKFKYRVYRCIANGLDWSEPLLECVRKEMTSKNSFERIYSNAVYSRHKQKPATSVAVLLEALRDESRETERIWAANACEIASVDDPGILEELRRMARSLKGAHAVRAVSALSIVSPNDAQISETLERTLRDQSPEAGLFPHGISDNTMRPVCVVSLSVLQRLGERSNQFESDLFNLISHSDQNVSIETSQAVKSLHLKNDGKVAIIRSALLHPNKSVRNVARKTLLELQKD